MGALVTIDPPVGAAVNELPWIITIGPFGAEEDWEPLVCGPYERPHALALARAVVERDDLMAVVEPVEPYLTAEQIRQGVAAARSAATEPFEAGPYGDEPVDQAMLERMTAGEVGPLAGEAGPPAGEVGPTAGEAGPPAGLASTALDAAGADPPSLDEVRAAFARLGARLSAISRE